MSRSARQGRRGGPFYCFQSALPLDDDASGEASAIASNGLLTALRVASGTTLVRYSLVGDARPATPSWWESGSPSHGLPTSENLLAVEDAVDATQLLQEFRAVQWSAIAVLWAIAGHDLPPLLERAAAILGSVSTDWESTRRVEYLGIACRDVVDTQDGIRGAEVLPLGPSDPTILFNSLSMMCHAELHEGAKAADRALVLVGSATGLLSARAADAWTARVLDELSPLQVSVKATGGGRSQVEKCSRRSR